MTSLLALTIAACASDWTRIPAPDPRPDIRGAVAWSGDEALFGGKAGYGGGARLYRVEGLVLREVYAHPRGTITAVAAHGDAAFAVLAVLADHREGSTPRPGSTYSVLSSVDRGRTWRVAGPLAVSSASQIAAVSESELWVLGEDTLMRSDDAGVTWDEVVAPGRRSFLDDQLAVDHHGVVLLGNPIRRLEEGGGWEEEVAGARVTAASGGWWVGQKDGAAVLRRPGGVWEPFPRVTASWAWPRRLWVDGERVTALVEDEAGSNRLLVIDSRDGGKTWTLDGFRASVFDPSSVIAPDGAVFVWEEACTGLLVRPAPAPRIDAARR